MEFVGVWFLNTKLNIPPERLYAANWVFQFSIITLCIEVIRTPYNSIIIAHERMSFYAITSIVEVLLKLLVVYILQSFTTDKLILYSILLTCVSLFIFFWYKIYCHRHFTETRYIYYWDSSLLKNLLSYSGWSIIVNAADVAVTQCINVFLNIFYGVVANAAMGIASQVNALLNNFLNSFTTSFNPQIIKSYASGEKTYFMKLLYSTSKVSFFLMFAVAFPIMFNIDYILKIWLGNPPEMADIFLICVACYSLFDSFSAPLWNAVHATGNLKVHQILMASIKLANIPLGYLALSQEAPAYSILLIYALLNGVCSLVRIIYLHYLINLDIRKFAIEVLFKIMIVTLFTIFITIGFSLIVPAEGFLKLFITSCIFVISYLPCIYFVGLNSYEKVLVINILSSIMQKIKISTNNIQI